MKRALFQLFNVLMACVVLLSSTGFGLVEHSCQMRGKKKTVVVAFSSAKPQPGCAVDRQPMPSDQTTVDRDQCCRDEAQYENVDTQASLSQLVAKFVKTVTETVFAGVVTLLTWLADWIFDRNSSSLLTSVSAPPSPSGRDILTFVRCFLI